MHQALEQFEQSTRQAVENFEQTNRLAAERGRAEQAARDRKLREQEAAVRAELAAQQHVEQTRRRAVLDEASKREAAWAKFYSKPQRCNTPPSNDALVECANEYIRAQREFELAYSAGKL